MNKVYVFFVFSIISAFLFYPKNVNAFTVFDTCVYYDPPGVMHRCDPSDSGGTSCPTSGPGAVCRGPVAVTTILASISPNNVPNFGSFIINMSSTNADSCTYSRTGTYAGNWTNQPVPSGTSYTTTASGWAGPGNATYTFTCGGDNLATAQATITIDAPPIPIVQLWFSSLFGFVSAFASNQ